jgi:hypothetical protein
MRESPRLNVENGGGWETFRPTNLGPLFPLTNAARGFVLIEKRGAKSSPNRDAAVGVLRSPAAGLSDADLLTGVRD